MSIRAYFKKFNNPANAIKAWAKDNSMSYWGAISWLTAKNKIRGVEVRFQPNKAWGKWVRYQARVKARKAEGRY